MKNSPKDLILHQLKTRSFLKQRVFDATKNTFVHLKEVLTQLPGVFNTDLNSIDYRLKLEFSDLGEFVSKLKVGGDVLVFNMHTNAFQFDRDHKVWELPYIKENGARTYCGVINIYNFLADSFRYNRHDDLGYLVARIFINGEGHFFVEGKRQRSMGLSGFGSSVISKEALLRIVETAMLYALEFDLLVPPYDSMKIVSLAQMNEEIMHSQMRTGKRLGFVFNSDDVNQ
jgi:hypothetical protein